MDAPVITLRQPVHVMVIFTEKDINTFAVDGITDGICHLYYICSSWGSEFRVSGRREE